MKYPGCYHFFYLLCFILLLHLLCGRAFAQWKSQDFNLKEGWNAIYVSVDAVPSNSCSAVFSGTPVTKAFLWRGNDKITHIDVSNPSNVYKDDDWYAWYSAFETNNLKCTLQDITGDSTYIVYSESDCQFTLKGSPCIPSQTWIGSSYNLVGFQVDPVDARRSSAPDYLTFQDWFSDLDAVSCTANRDSEVVYYITSDPSDKTKIFELDITSMANNTVMAVNPGKAYWIYARETTDFCGDIVIKPSGGVVDFGTQANESMLTIENMRDSANYVTISYRSSDSGPESGVIPPRLPLLYFKNELNDSGWCKFPEDGFNINLSAGEERVLRIAVDRTEMNADDAVEDGWCGILQVGGEYGSLVDVGLHADYSSSTSGVLWPDGLWYGTVSFTQCTRVPSMTNQAALTPVSYPLKGRLIVHISESAEVKATLMQRALLVHGEVDEEGNVAYTLYDNEDNLPDSGNVTKFSSVLFGYRNSIAATSASVPLDKVSFEWSVGTDDVDNPFRHPYHPGHDGLNADFDGSSLTEEIFAVQHSLELEWDSLELDSTDQNAAFWSPEEIMEGDCTLTLKNLRKIPIELQGRFELKRVAPVAAVNK